MKNTMLCCEILFFWMSLVLLAPVSPSAKVDNHHEVEDRRYLGCYKDLYGDRTLRGYAWPLNSHLTVDSCIKDCIDFHYAGAENGRFCYCGNEDYTRHGACYSEASCTCYVPCRGNTTQMCGGNYALSVFKTECKESHKWGPDCDRPCYCKDDEGCRMRNGRCPNDECARGWTGESCNEVCPDGTYGYDCSETCNCLDDEVCDRETGWCSGGLCPPGYINLDPSCQTECEDGTYGLDCAHICNCYDDEVCDKKNGSCPSGMCKPGFDFDADPSCQNGNGGNDDTVLIALLSVFGIIIVTGTIVTIVMVRQGKIQCAKESPRVANMENNDGYDIINVAQLPCTYKEQPGGLVKTPHQKDAISVMDFKTATPRSSQSNGVTQTTSSLHTNTLASDGYLIPRIATITTVGPQVANSTAIGTHKYEDLQNEKNQNAYTSLRKTGSDKNSEI